MERLTITNGKLILPTGIKVGQTLICKNGKIEQIIPNGGYQPLVGGKVIGARQNYVPPGFIDAYIHEGGGHDFMGGAIEAFLGVVETHAKYNTTVMIPTILTSTNEESMTMFTVYRKARETSINGSQFIGLHSEGLYFSPKQCGTQDPNFLEKLQVEEYNAILEVSEDIIRWNVAPKLEGALALGQALQQHHTLPPIAHTDATYGEVEKAFTAGYIHVTHLYSVISSVAHKNASRYAGVIEAACLIENMTVEIITDDIHLLKPLSQLVYKSKGVNKTALCTDAVRGAGIPDGESMLSSLNNGQKVIIEDGVAKMPDQKAFAGSATTTDRLARTMVYLAGVPLIDAARIMTLMPACIFHIDKEKGSLKIGKDAGMVIFDNQVSINNTVLRGHVIHTK